jgi:hypothetical protein
VIEHTATARRLRECKSRQHDTARPDRLNIVLDAGGFRLVSNFIRTLSVSELILSSQEVTPHQSRSGKKVPCTVLNVTATTRKSVCWRLKKHPNLTTAKLRLSMASSWLSIACQDEAMDNLLASLDTAEDRDRGGTA